MQPSIFNLRVPLPRDEVFLMNTLTALSQVIEEKPAAAVSLIADLAAEIRSLSRFSGEKLVTLAEELALCLVKPVGRINIDRQQPRQWQVDLLDLPHVEAVMQRTQPAICQ